MIETDPISCVFDAVLLGIHSAEGHADFVANASEYHVALPSPMHWRVGARGVLRFNNDGTCLGFSPYLDQRLRRAPARDDLPNQRWGWVIEDHTFSVRAGIVPGLAGAVLHDECRLMQIPIPPEFQDLCELYDLEPLGLLRDFIADVARITNSRWRPREDGFCSNGTAARFLAHEYLRHAHRCQQVQDEALNLLEDLREDTRDGPRVD